MMGHPKPEQGGRVQVAVQQLGCVSIAAAVRRKGQTPPPRLREVAGTA